MERVLVGTELGSLAVIPRNDSAESLFPFNFAFSCRRKIWTENFISDVRSLMRSLLVVVRQPFTVYVIQLIQAHADKMVQAFSLDLADKALAVSVCHRRAHRSSNTSDILTFPKCPKPLAVFGIPVMDQVPDSNAQILKPHGCITGLLKNPILRGIKCCWAHENTATSQVNKYEHVRVNPSTPRQDGLGEKVCRHQRIHVRANKLLPLAGRVPASFFRDRVASRPLEDVADCRSSDTDTQLHQFTLNAFISPRKVFDSKLHNQIYSRLRRSWTARFLRFGIFLRSQPATVGAPFNHKQYIINIMVKFCSKPSKLRSFFRAGVNPVRINTGSQHFNLISQQLKPSIVSATISGLKKLLKYLKHPQKIAHISLNLIDQIFLKINMLRALICFRTPRKSRELVKLPKLSVSSYPKAGFEVGKIRIKWFEMMLRRLGTKTGLSSHRHPARWPELDGFPKSENGGVLSRFCYELSVTCCGSA